MPQTELLVFQDTDGTAPFLNWLKRLEKKQRRAYVKCLGRLLLLSQQGFELRRPHADFLRDGVYELRAKVGRVNYRILYVFCGENVVCISHGITKEKDVPDKEIDLAAERKKLVEADRDKYTATFPLTE